MKGCPCYTCDEREECVANDCCSLFLDYLLKIKELNKLQNNMVEIQNKRHMDNREQIPQVY